jgi:hypothetical protein
MAYGSTGRYRHPLGALSSRISICRRLTIAAISAALLAGAGALALAPGVGAHPVARTARTITLNDSGRLRLTSHHGFTLNEKGTASGTIPGTIYIHLNVSSTNSVTAEVNIYPSGGSLTGKASAGYHVHGAYATFNGTMKIARGTGRYSRARGSDLSFTGTIQRSSDAVGVRVSGRMSY